VRRNPAAAREYWGRAGAGVLPYCPDTGRFLLAFRSAYVNEPHTWGIWGGAVDPGESPEDAACREVREEMGITAEPDDLQQLYVYRDGSFTYVSYLLAVDEEFEPSLDWETEGFRWVPLDELVEMEDLHYGVKALLPALQEIGE